jgi:hypothetical protein
MRQAGLANEPLKIRRDISSRVSAEMAAQSPSSCCFDKTAQTLSKLVAGVAESGHPFIL